MNRKNFSVSKNAENSSFSRVHEGLYSVRKTTILEKENIVDIIVPQWLLNPMCAVWNSEIKVIYVKDRMGDDNYSNAISNYLPKLVNE